MGLGSWGQQQVAWEGSGQSLGTARQRYFPHSAPACALTPSPPCWEIQGSGENDRLCSGWKFSRGKTLDLALEPQASEGMDSRPWF